MKTLAVSLMTLLFATSAHAILILPYGHWTLTKMACTQGGVPTPGMNRSTRFDLHLEEQGEFQAASLSRTGWSVARGTMTVDHANAEMCLETLERSKSTDDPSPIIEPTKVCGHYAKPNEKTLVVTFGSYWMGLGCPENESLELTYMAIPEDEETN